MSIIALSGLNFTSRTEYLNWCSEWRAEYQSLSSTIRRMKDVSKQGSMEERSSAQRLLRVLSSQATALLKIRASSKKKAQIIWEQTQRKFTPVVTA